MHQVRPLLTRLSDDSLTHRSLYKRLKPIRQPLIFDSQYRFYNSLYYSIVIMYLPLHIRLTLHWIFRTLSCLVKTVFKKIVKLEIKSNLFSILNSNNSTYFIKSGASVYKIQLLIGFLILIRTVLFYNYLSQEYIRSSIHTFSWTCAH